MGESAANQLSIILAKLRRHLTEAEEKIADMQLKVWEATRAADAEIADLQDRLDREIACNEANCIAARTSRERAEQAERERDEAKPVLQAARELRRLALDQRSEKGTVLAAVVGVTVAIANYDDAPRAAAKEVGHE